MTKFLPVLTIVAALGAACGTQAVDLDKIPVGTEVAIAKQDGGLVKGALAERDAATVKVNVGQTVRTVERTEIAAAQIVDPEKPEEAIPVEARFTEHTVPAGTDLDLTLVTAIDSKTSRANEPIIARTAEAVVIDGVTVIPAESQITGAVTSATPAGKVKGRGAVALAFNTLTIEGHDAPYGITSAIDFVADPTHKRDAATIGVPTAGGAIIGGILGGKKGAVIGGVVGAGAGTTAVLTTTGSEVSLPAGTKVRVNLDRAVDVRVPIKK